MMIDAIFLTLKLAATTTLLLLVLCLPLAHWLSKTQSIFKPLIEAVVALPLVLPPTVLGFYLLVWMSPNHPLGQLWVKVFDRPLAFSFAGLVLGSVLYSLPFVMQPLQRTFEGQSNFLKETAYTIGANPWQTFWAIQFPLARPGLIAASVLGFAHTVGEFGVVLMIGGNIPGSTQVLSILLFDQVESSHYQQAHLLAGGLVLTSVITLFCLYRWNRHASVRVGA
jgi:molybdate transport system permease protein